MHIQSERVCLSHPLVMSASVYDFILHAPFKTLTPSLHEWALYRLYKTTCLPLSSCVHTSESMNIHLALCVCVCVCVCVAPSVSPRSNRVGWLWVVQGKEKGTMNDIDRQRAAARLPVPGTLSWSLIADVCLIAGGAGRPGYVSVSSVSACQEAKPPSEPPITASN